MARTSIRCQRTLPKPGQILVQPGDHVESTQVVARTRIPDDFCIVDVARLLGIPGVEVSDYLEVELGKSVRQGDVIARRGRLFARRATSPIDGVISGMGNGHVLIEAHPVPFELHAYVSGTVVEKVGDDLGVSIETAGVFIQGMWGSGGEGTGVLKVLAKKRDDPLTAQAIGPACHGSILVAGTVAEREPLIRAQSVDVRGVVSGGLSPSVLPIVGDLPFPLVITDGFGKLPMMEKVFSLLKEHDGRQASINGETATWPTTSQPEIIIPVPNGVPASDQAESSPRLSPGVRVRAVRAPYAGRVGTVVGIPSRPSSISTGVRVRCAKVALGASDPTIIPLVNLEILR